MNAAFLQFLSSAALGELRVGISCSEILSQIGPASARSIIDKGAEIWRYGPLQLTIANDKLEALKLDCLEGSPLPAPLRHVEVLPVETPLYTFIDMLDDHGIGWEVDPAYSFDRQLCIRTEKMFERTLTSTVESSRAFKSSHLNKAPSMPRAGRAR